MSCTLLVSSIRSYKCYSLPEKKEKRGKHTTVETIIIIVIITCTETGPGVSLENGSAEPRMRTQVRTEASRPVTPT